MRQAKARGRRRSEVAAARECGRAVRRGARAARRHLVRERPGGLQSIVAEPGVEQVGQLAHDDDEGRLRLLSVGLEALVNGLESGVASGAVQLLTSTGPLKATNRSKCLDGLQLVGNHDTFGTLCIGKLGVARGRSAPLPSSLTPAPPATDAAVPPPPPGTRTRKFLPFRTRPPRARLRCRTRQGACWQQAGTLHSRDGSLRRIRSDPESRAGPLSKRERPCHCSALRRSTASSAAGALHAPRPALHR